MKKLLCILLLIPLAAFASEQLPLDDAPVNLADKVSLQRGARTFVNYCLTCHSASYMRYNRLQDLGLTEQQIKDNLLLATDKVGDTMSVAMRRADAKQWLYGAFPPDLSVVARARGADWLYTFLRNFYRDPLRPNGWNNALFHNVAMPNVLYQLQGQQGLKVETHTDEHGNKHENKKMVMDKPGTLTRDEFDTVIGDLVNFMVYMGEPAQIARIPMGVVVLLFLAVFLVVVYATKREYWKDIH
ncbi:MAG: cytochrome c1 [Burkholderiales bacterium]